MSSSARPVPTWSEHQPSHFFKPGEKCEKKNFICVSKRNWKIHSGDLNRMKTVKTTTRTNAARNRQEGKLGHFDNLLGNQRRKKLTTSTGGSITCSTGTLTGCTSSKPTPLCCTIKPCGRTRRQLPAASPGEVASVPIGLGAPRGLLPTLALVTVFWPREASFMAPSTRVARRRLGPRGVVECLCQAVWRLPSHDQPSADRQGPSCRHHFAKPGQA